MRALLPLLIAACLVAPVAGWAQCPSNASSCVSCHETRGLHPVLADTHPWHVDHGYGDLCAACHGGDPEAAEAAAAHLALRPPLASPAESCGGCHAADADARAQRYLAVRARELAAPAPTQRPVQPSIAAPTPRAVVVHSDRATIPVAALALALALALVGLVLRDLRRLPAFAPGRWVRARQWTPYAAGALLGVVVAVSEALFQRPIAASGAFDRLAAWPGRWLFPRNFYFTHVMRPAIGWPVWVIIGVLAGSFAAARCSGEARLRTLPDTLWSDAFGTRHRTRVLVAFVGALLVQLGADIAGGCTSGLAISGGAVLAPGAFVFIAGMFIGGLPAARWWYRRSK